MIANSKILSIIKTGLDNSDNYSDDTDLKDALSYYLGEPNGTEVDGRSQVVSTDVADAIEWIMPQIMKSFTQNNEIVIFDPVHEGDEQQAELESEYVYEILMKQNNGFIILHQFVKDALMQRNGILKVYYAETTHNKIETYTGISDNQLNQLLAAEGVELLEQSSYEDQGAAVQIMQLASAQGMDPSQIPVPLMHDVKVAVERIKQRIYVDPVPREEFRVTKNHNNICVDDAKFTAHVTTSTVSEVIDEYGISFDEAKELAAASSSNDKSQYRFSTQNESYSADESEDESQRDIEIAECYLMIDLEGYGKAVYAKVTAAGGDDPTKILSVEELDASPWVTCAAILMSHKFQGLSIYDRIKQIQDLKTSLWRNVLDNFYLQNNQRTAVVENQVNMDDLLVSRPGGVVRTKRLDAIQALTTPAIGQAAFQMIDYADRVRAGRTGVDPDGNATPQNIGERVGSQGVDRLMNAKEELVGLIVRVIAETGIKPLCTKLRDLCTKHLNAVVDYRFRGVWQQVNPSTWQDRTTCTVRVGTGTGDHAAKIMALDKVLAYQEKLMADPRQALVDHKQVYTALDDLCKFSGLNGATRYYVDPDSPQGKQKLQQIQQQQNQSQQGQQQLEMLMAQSQNKLAEAEQAKAQAQMASAQARAQADMAKNQLAMTKQAYEAELALMRQDLDAAKAQAENALDSAELNLKKYEIDTNAAVKISEIEAKTKTEQSKNFDNNRDGVSDAS